MSKTTFVVEDQLIVAEEIVTMLESRGFEVVGNSKKWQEAYDKIIALRPSILLLDIKLGEKADGVELASEILKVYQPHVFFVTAYADKETLSRAKDLYPSGYIVKPINEAGLFAAIEIGLAHSEKKEHMLEEVANRFSEREIEVIKHIAQGFKVEEIADSLFVSINTIKTHKKTIFRKANTSNTAELMVFAFTNNLI